MAIDSRRKRASVAALGLAFLGPSIVPDGSFVQADRQAIAHSYYGILAGGAFVQIGGTAQLEAFTSTGGITLERAIGGTSQLEAFTSTGGITLERVIGGTAQLEAFTSSGVIQVGDVVTTVRGRRHRTRRYRTPAPFEESLEEAYTQLQQTAARGKLRRLVGPHVLAGDHTLTAVPPVGAVNFDSLAHDAENLVAFFDLWLEYVEEEDVILMLADL
jgi:hypothetical protein